MKTISTLNYLLMFVLVLALVVSLKSEANDQRIRELNAQCLAIGLSGTGVALNSAITFEQFKNTQNLKKIEKFNLLNIKGDLFFEGSLLKNETGKWGKIKIPNFEINLVYDQLVHSMNYQSDILMSTTIRNSIRNDQLLQRRFFLENNLHLLKHGRITMQINTIQLTDGTLLRSNALPFQSMELSLKDLSKFILKDLNHSSLHNKISLSQQQVKSLIENRHKLQTSNSAVFILMVATGSFGAGSMISSNHNISDCF